MMRTGKFDMKPRKKGGGKKEGRNPTAKGQQVHRNQPRTVLSAVKCSTHWGVSADKCSYYVRMHSC